jgi:alkylhydroperoxidase family enzyme
MIRLLALTALTFAVSWPFRGIAAEPSSIPKPIPATRPELKQALESLKTRQPRLPLEASFAGAAGAGLLPASWGDGGGLGAGVENESGWDGRLIDFCFWIVSRGNNCHYCLGHQELKLKFSGLNDDTIATLDSDWSGFSPREQAAMKFARKLTLEPWSVGNAEIVELTDQFSNQEIVKLVFTIACFNAANRWADGVGVPHEGQFSDGRQIKLDTPTSERFQRTKSIVVSVISAPLKVRTWGEVEGRIDACRSRLPRVALPTNEESRKAIADVIGDRAPLAWEQALAALPVNGPAHVKVWNTITSDDNLTPRLKAEMAFITAANNGAWYAAAHAAHRLKQLGASSEDLTSLLRDHEPSAGGAAAAYHLAAKSTRDPHLITDADLAAVRENYSDRETAEIMQVICMANLFDRFTESLGLPVEAEIVDGNYSQR